MLVFYFGPLFVSYLVGMHSFYFLKTLDRKFEIESCLVVFVQDLFLLLGFLLLVLLNKVNGRISVEMM